MTPGDRILAAFQSYKHNSGQKVISLWKLLRFETVISVNVYYIYIYIITILCGNF